MRISCNAAPVEQLELKERLRLIAEAGFTHVSLASFWWRGREFIDREAYARLKSTLAESPLEPDWFHSPFCWPSLDTHDEDHWTASLAAHIFYLERAAELGCRAYVIHPYFDPLSSTHPREKVYARVVEGARLLTAQAEALGVPLAIENMPYAEHAELVVQILEDVPSIKFCLDAGHANIRGDWERWKPYLSRLVCTHFHDNGGAEDDHLYPGEGSIDWASLRAMLLEAGYDGVWGLELNDKELPETGRLEEARTRLKKAYERARMIVDGTGGTA